MELSFNALKKNGGELHWYACSLKISCRYRDRRLVQKSEHYLRRLSIIVP